MTKGCPGCNREIRDRQDYCNYGCRERAYYEGKLRRERERARERERDLERERNRQQPVVVFMESGGGGGSHRGGHGDSGVARF
ncbi:hypothetical protein CORC01_02746 [Colletotrichum orchidophilum]|uniref:Uncharacterized protein n=1 Tax=Colletotrichum orchidophilum TaxID=1209926 RepID=A0A1G4BKP5_9PEZI|nr:uncharacterized protein CORC01_02746 [Colletotrichum orchidophilum]OHF01868.1 hypothetical protein CORC01_02746 [Colletotrichum orchidophilum]